VTSQPAAPTTGALGTSDRRELFWLLLALAVALAIRLVALVAFRDRYFGDQDEYLEGARRLLAGLPLAQRNSMFFVRAPGYPTFIALTWLVTGSQSPDVPRVVQALLGTLTCWYVFRLTRLLTPARPARWLALLATIFYPYLLYQCSYLGTESLFAFLVATSSFYLVKGLGQDQVAWRPLLVGAVLLSLSNLVRPNLAVTLPLAGLWLLYHYRRRLLDALKIAAVIVLPALLLSVPWTLSVHRQGLGWMWITDGAGIWYWVGHQEAALMHYGCVPATAEDIRLSERWMFTGSDTHTAARKLPLDRQQDAFWQAARAWDRKNLDKLPCVTAGKIWGYWRPWVSQMHYSTGAVLVSLYSLPVLLLGFYGLWRARSRGERLLSTWALLNMLAGTLTAAIFSTEVRYRVPVVDVLLLSFLGLGALDLWQRISARLFSRSPAALTSPAADPTR
jgi:hypothetical protein